MAGREHFDIYWGFVSGMDRLSLKEWQKAVQVLKHSKQRSMTIYSQLATVSP